jgi:hypothetical protein
LPKRPAILSTKDGRSRIIQQTAFETGRSPFPDIAGEIGNAVLVDAEGTALRVNIGGILYGLFECRHHAPIAASNFALRQHSAALRRPPELHLGRLEDRSVSCLKAREVRSARRLREDLFNQKASNAIAAVRDIALVVAEFNSITCCIDNFNEACRLEISYECLRVLKPCREHTVHSHFVLEICPDFERAQGHSLSLS